MRRTRTGRSRDGRRPAKSCSFREHRAAPGRARIVEEATMRSRAFLLMFGLSLVSLLLLDTAPVGARATGGASRAPRSPSPPIPPPPPPPTPSGVPTPPPATSQPQQPVQRPGMFGGFMGGLAGFALGGLLGSMLFGGMGGGFGGGIGLLALVLIGCASVLAFRVLRGHRRRRAA